jgi:hypothetical protein
LSIKICDSFIRTAASRTWTVKDNIGKSGIEIRLLISYCPFFLKHSTASMSQESRQATGASAACLLMSHSLLDHSSSDAAKLQTPAHDSALPMCHTKTTSWRHNRSHDLQTHSNSLIETILYQLICQNVSVCERH